MLELVSFILASIATVLITVFGGIYNGISDIWKPILILIGLTLAIVFLYFLVLLIVASCINRKKPVEKPSKAALIIFKITLAFIMRWSGAKVIVRGKEKAPKGNALWIMNHRSNFDPMVLSNVFKFNNMIMVSKEDNFKIPILGGFIHKMGYLAIDRKNDREALKVILKLIARVREGYSVAIYPEGTRNKTEADLLPFRSGVFKIATQTKAPIVVTTVCGTEKIHKNFPFRRTKVYLDIIKVIEPEDYAGKQTHEISEEAEQMMLSVIKEHKNTYNKKQ